MAQEFSTYGANAILNGTAIPATLYLKPHVGNPGAAGTANAASETSRQAFTRDTSTAGTNKNPSSLQWLSVAASGTETWTYWSAWDAASGGNCWAVGQFTTAPAVVAGDTVNIAAGDLNLAVTIWT